MVIRTEPRPAGDVGSVHSAALGTGVGDGTNPPTTVDVGAFLGTGVGAALGASTTGCVTSQPHGHVP